MKRKAASSMHSSTDYNAESSFAVQNVGKGILYEEATGKTVDFIRYVDQSHGSPAFEIRFIDGTFLFIEPVPRVDFRVRLLKSSRGSIKTVRDYGITR